MFSYDKIKNVLMHNKAKVTFTKADGSERVMICTLDMNLIPKDNHPKNYKESTNRDNIKVFDLEINQWRSFRVDSVKSISVRKSYWTNRTENMKAA